MFKHHFSTSPLVQKTSALSALLLIIFVVAAQVPQNTDIVASKNSEVTQDMQSRLVDSDHYLYAATYSIKGSSSSTLGLNNAMSKARTVRVRLYSKAGEALDLPELTLAPNETKFLNLQEWITPERIGTFSEGSAEVYFHGPGMAIGAQLTVSDERHNQSFDVLLREDVNFSSAKLDSLWLSLDHQTTVDVFVANTRPHPTTVTPTLYVNGEVLRGESMALDSHVAETIDIGRLLKKLRVRREVVAGGISLEHNGQPGAIAVAGVMSNKQRGFSSTMRFVDIAKHGSTKLHGANILIGAANPQSGLPEDAHFTPRAVVRNTTGAPIEVKAQVRYTTDDGLGAKEIEPVTLSANEVRDLDLNSIIADLSTKKIIDAGVELEHGGGPGSVIAAVLSVDHSGNHVFDVPLKDPRSVSNVGGNYPWRIDGNNRAVVHIKNVDLVTDGSLREFAIMITTAAGMYSFPLQLTKAGETVAIDISKLRDEQIRDNRGNAPPCTITQGQVEWYGRGALGQFVGRLVQYNPTGVSSSMSCETFCDCEPIYLSCRVTPTSITGVEGQTFDLRAWETDQRCDGSTFECEVYATFNPDIQSVVEVNNVLFPRVAFLGDDAGSATITGTWQVPGPSCGSTIGVNHFISVTNIGVSISGPQNVQDGSFLDPSFSLTAQGGNPTSYQWSWSAPPGVGNNPLVTFTPSNQSSTVTNRHWFANPNVACPSPPSVSVPPVSTDSYYNAVYTITGQANFSGGLSANDSTTLTVNAFWNPAGTVAPPVISGGPTLQFNPSTNLWFVLNSGNMVRNTPVMTIHVPSGSQFHNKTVVHENRHVQQYQTGMNSDLFTVASLMAQISQLTDATSAGLTAKIVQEFNNWHAGQLALVQIRRAAAEQDAHSVSDPILPQYAYQLCQ